MPQFSVKGMVGMPLWLKFAGDLAAKIFEAFHLVPSNRPLRTSSPRTQDVSHCAIYIYPIGEQSLT
jgi:hypothetical protein